MKRIRRILHASDFSPASRGAFAKAVEMAKTNRAELMLLHVMAPLMMPLADGYMAPKVYEDFVRTARAAARKQVDALVAKARKAGVRVTGLLAEGVSHEQILRTARAKRADLVILGTHGRTGLTKLMIGSVAGRVVAMATCPVMTVRAK